MPGRSIAERIRRRREEVGLSQTDLAHQSGISRTYLSLIERGEAKNISLNVLSRLAVALSTSASSLTGEAEEEVVLSPSLRKFALEDGIPFEDILMLSRLALRGKAPETVEDWRRFYKAIARALEPEE
jgi:transcriptional regulator with XRE-family HTH domain